MSDAYRLRDDLWKWGQLCEAVRALDAVVDDLPPEEDAEARRLRDEVDALRVRVERRVLGPLGVEVPSDRE